MLRWFFIILVLSSLTCPSAKGQTPAYIAVATADQIPWERFIPSDKRFVVVGEAHHVSSIFPFQLSQLQYLVTKGFRNLIWEMPYSYCLIGDRYIKTGNDSLLSFIAWSKEDMAYWKSVYQLNQTLAEGDKLHLWGIDLELGDNVDGSAYRTRLFKKALSLLTEGKGDLPPVLQQAFTQLERDSTVEKAIEIKHRLQKMQQLPEVVAYYGDRLAHFQILMNRMDHFEPLRNDEMLEAFKEIYSLFHLDSNAKFLGRFGWGHTDKSYNKSMSWLLEHDARSPVQNNTMVVGVQYLSCKSWSGQKEITLENYGIVDDRGQKQALASLNKEDPAAIKIFTWPVDEKPKGWAKAADVLFVFNGFAGITPLKGR